MTTHNVSKTTQKISKNTENVSKTTENVSKTTQYVSKPYFPEAFALGDYVAEGASFLQAEWSKMGQEAAVPSFPDRGNFVGIPAQATAYVAAALGKVTQAPGVVVIVKDELRARTLALDLGFYGEGEVPILHGRPLNLSDPQHRINNLELQRLALWTKLLALQGHFGEVPAGPPFYLILPANILMERLPKPEEFAREVFSLRKGQRIPIEELTSRLAHLGYDAVNQVDSMGGFVRRGDIVDFCTADPNRMDWPLAWRISFFDDEIDDIKIFDLETQRSVGKVGKDQACLVFPCREFCPDAPTRAALGEALTRLLAEKTEALLGKAGQDTRALLGQIQQRTQQDLENLQEAEHTLNYDRMVGIMKPQGNILDYIPPTMPIVVEEIKDCQKAMDTNLAAFYAEAEGYLEKGYLLGPELEAKLSPGEAMKRVNQAERLYAVMDLGAGGNGLPRAPKFNLALRSCDNYYQQDELFIQDMSRKLAAGTRLIFACAQKENQEFLSHYLERKLEDYARHRRQVAILPTSPGQGFVFPGLAVELYANEEIFGKKVQSKKRRYQGKKINFYGELAEGDYVVHDDYGIGIYKGIVTREDGLVARDYLHVQYAGHDELFLPVEDVSQLQKYIGKEAGAVKLSKFRSTDWEKKKLRASESVKKLAFSLLDLYLERKKIPGHAFGPDDDWQQKFEDQFPYEDTPDQIVALNEIKQDLEEDKVMDRLLCGDVGFGKTEVAFRSMFKVINDGYQAVMIVPTTVLAKQHYETLAPRLRPFGFNIALLSRNTPAKEARAIVQGLKRGTVDLVIGTHKVLGKEISFKSLGLIVVDEEQRFGVGQKESMKNTYKGVDVLSLSATPIPRTLHMSLSGIRDISLLTEGPLDRRPVQTYVMEYDENICQEAILKEVARQGQVFYLFNQTRGLAAKAQALGEAMPGLRIAYAHASMSAERIEEVMADFIDQKYDVLVCTTIIESGIDMPNVNTIIVENADRFGLAQLYQIKGRVGRSGRQAYAYITYRPDREMSEVARKRLTAIRDFTELGSGFKIAMRDLEVRGAGNLLGAEQSGHMESVGFDLFTRMLEESVTDLKAGRISRADLEKTPDLSKLFPRKKACVVDLPVQAILPESFVTDPGERIEIYRKLLAMENLNDYQEILDEVLDRFGDAPEPFMNLLAISYIRARASQAGVEQVKADGANVLISWPAHRKIDPDDVGSILNVPGYGDQLYLTLGQQPQLVFLGAGAPVVKVADKVFRLFLAGEAYLEEVQAKMAKGKATKGKAAQ